MIDIETIFTELTANSLRTMEPIEQEIFRVRLEQGWADILRPLQLLYGQRADFDRWLLHFLDRVAENYAQRSKELRLLDHQRLAAPDWFQRSEMLGYVCYTDRFAEDGRLAGVIDKLDYLAELGVTYLHLMPLLQPRPGNSDGGYAVMNYRQVDDQLGDMDDLRDLAAQLRARQMSLVVDFVCNHTAKEHRWARAAMDGDERYQDYYFMFPDRTIPDQYEQTLREIFPEFKPGNFTYYPHIDKWVWTTFNEFQWDLNYQNPAVFGEMLDIMLYLANQGVEILRLDAVAFMWKRMGTDCENQPEAHAILQAFRALSRIAAPALILKAEAIVPPPQLVPYLGQGEATNKECEIAYHNVLMVMLWSSLAERRVVLATHALQQIPRIPSGTSWVTYIRCHDDIGWAVTEEDAAAVGLNGYEHRSFLSEFYNGDFPGTFARGTTFQFNPKNNDRRINGSLASLAGLERALEAENWQEMDLAIKRILLLHNIIFAFGGTPLIYMGDEIGLLNDYEYVNEPDHKDDSRWVHRPVMDWQRAASRNDWQTIPGRIYKGLQTLIAARKRTPQLHAESATYPIWTHNDQVFGFLRESPRGRLLVLGNFTEQVQVVSRGRLAELGFHGVLVDQITELPLNLYGDVPLKPYQAVWLKTIG